MRDIRQRSLSTLCYLVIALLGSLVLAPVVGTVRAETESIEAGIPEWLSDFEDPPATFRPQMFWVWNGDLNRERTTEVLEQYAARGVGGVFVHPRPGLITEYLSPEFFEQWQWTLTECKRLGLECHIYDENGFPSGFASGEVVASNPTLAAHFLTPIKVTDPDQQPDGPIVGWFMPKEKEIPERVGKEAVASATHDHPIWALAVRQVAAKPQHGSHPYPDMLLPETTELFISSTHDRYARLFQEDFGETIKYVFTDEPTIMGASGYPWSDYLLLQFRQEHGYDLRDKIAALCFGGPDASAVRFDYFQTVGRLWIRYQHQDFLLGQEADTNQVQAISELQQQLLSHLHAAQIDFDLGDELTMAELGAVQSGRLRIGQAAYDAVVIPAAMENWTAETLDRVAEYLKAGGEVFTSGRPPSFVDGRRAREPEQLSRTYSKQWQTFADPDRCAHYVKSCPCTCWANYKFEPCGLLKTPLMEVAP